MKRSFVLICYNLGLWGILGFFATLFLGYLCCCAGLSKPVFFGALILFALVGIILSIICIARGCKKTEKNKLDQL